MSVCFTGTSWPSAAPLPASASATATTRPLSTSTVTGVASSGLVLACCLGPEALQARAWLIELWRLLRPALLGREAKPPRTWST